MRTGIENMYMNVGSAAGVAAKQLVMPTVAEKKERSWKTKFDRNCPVDKKFYGCLAKSDLKFVRSVGKCHVPDDVNHCSNFLVYYSKYQFNICVNMIMM